MQTPKRNTQKEPLGTHHPPHAALVLLPLAGHFGARCWDLDRIQE